VTFAAPCLLDLLLGDLRRLAIDRPTWRLRASGPAMRWNITCGERHIDSLVDLAVFRCLAALHAIALLEAWTSA
jgi:hypothetical protein